MELEHHKSQSTIELEKNKSEADRILKAIDAGNPDHAAENLKFLVDTGLISDTALIQNIREFLAKRQKGTGPFLSTSSGSIVCDMDENGQCHWVQMPKGEAPPAQK